MDESSILLVKTIQLKRGTQQALELKLQGEDKPLSGEVIFELPSEGHPGGRLKLGDGNRDYISLPYLPDSVTFTEVIQQMEEILSAVRELEASTEEWASKAVIAKEAAVEAAQSAQRIPEETMIQVNNYMNKKLHFMSAEEYNALEKIDRDGFYFITMDN